MILLPALPTRIAFTPPSSPSTTYLGTILFAGLVPTTNGVWFGVEWDDPARGKHDGVHEGTGVRYFFCRVKGAGSFIRPHAAGISFGVSFRQALRSKYLEEDGKVDSGEASTFYSTSSNFEVEVVSLSKIRDKFRQLGKLRDVGLEWEGVNGAGSAEEREAVGRELERIELLNLSYLLVPSFEALSEISGNLPTLRSLYANSNRFAPLSQPTTLLGFAHLTSLHLNKTLVSWAEMLLLSPSLPVLKELELGSNLLFSLAPPPDPPIDPFPALAFLNLHSNLLADWADLVASLARLPSLDRLILSSNQLASIPPPARGAPTLRTLRHLSLASNALQSWADIDSLNSLPSLEGIWIGENPLFEGVGEEKGALFLLARIARLTVLEGTKITPTQKEDAELFYISCVGKEDLGAEERAIRHPRYLELLKKYGQSPPAAKKVSTLKSKLIHLRITSNISSEPATLAVLPTLPTRLLRTHISRLLKRPLPASQFSLVAVLQPNGGGDAADEDDRPRVEIPSSEEGRQVSWWGLLDGDEVRVEAT